MNINYTVELNDSGEAILMFRNNITTDIASVKVCRCQPINDELIDNYKWSYEQELIRKYCKFWLEGEPIPQIMVYNTATGGVYCLSTGNIEITFEEGVKDTVWKEEYFPYTYDDRAKMREIIWDRIQKCKNYVLDFINKL